MDAISPMAAVDVMLKSGMSQIEISRRTGIPQPRLSKWITHGYPAAVHDAHKLVVLHREVIKKEGHQASSASAEQTEGACQ